MISAPDHPDDAEQLWEAYCRDRNDTAARNRLVEHYLPLVKQHARNLRARLPKFVEIADLVAAGTFGLMDAVAGYDPGRGVAFAAFAGLRIRGAMLDALRNWDHVPRTIRQRAKRLAAAIEDLEDRLGRTPTDEELAKALGLSTAELRQLRREVRPRRLRSLDAGGRAADGLEELELRDILPDARGVDPVRQIQRDDLRRLMGQSLSRNERAILTGYYYEDRSMREIADGIGLSESRVSQMHSALLWHLRGRLMERQGEFRG